MVWLPIYYDCCPYVFWMWLKNKKGSAVWCSKIGIVLFLSSVFDSFYDSYRGVVAQISVKQGTIKVGNHIVMMSNGYTYEVTELGIRKPTEEKVDKLSNIDWLSPISA